MELVNMSAIDDDNEDAERVDNHSPHVCQASLWVLR